MLRPTPPVKRVCYADAITVWATGPNIPQLESMINNYLRDVSIYLKDKLLLIFVPKSTVTLFTPEKHQFQMHPDITLEDTQLPLERSPKILGVILAPSISFLKHCNYVSDRIDKRNDMLKALAGSSWGQDQEDSKRHSLQAVELSQRTQAAVQIVSNLSPPTMGARFTVFWGHAGRAEPLDGWRCCTQKRVMSTQIKVRQPHTNKSGFVISAINKYMLGSIYP